MYCPKCNQQQVSEEMRFCSRCGFPLAGVALLLENNGIIPQLNSGTDQESLTNRRKILSKSAYLTLVAWAIAFVAMLFVNVGGPFEIVAGIAAIVFFVLGLIGLVRFVYGYLSRDSAPTVLQDQSSERLISEPTRRASLPPQQSLPVSDYPRRTNTKEMASPPSVTENTTRLLDEQPK